MNHKISKEDQAEVLKLSDDGLTYNQIAETMKEKYPDRWSAKYANKSIMRIVQKSKEKQAEIKIAPNRTLDEMGREERILWLTNRLQNTNRFKAIFASFTEPEKEFFVEEYSNIIKSVDSLTEIEEQSLFAAVLELVLAYRALQRKEREESYYEQSLEGKILPGDIKYRTEISDKYQKEYDQHARLYQNGIEQLKMTREQRLKEIKAGHKTLVNLAEEFSYKSVQNDIARRIEELSKLRDESLKEMIENKYIYGYFE